jgi:hypothetical protein
MSRDNQHIASLGGRWALNVDGSKSLGSEWGKRKKTTRTGSLTLTLPPPVHHEGSDFGPPLAPCCDVLPHKGTQPSDHGLKPLKL